MKVFEQRDGAIDSLSRKYKIARSEIPMIESHLDKFDFMKSDVKIGQFFLYEVYNFGIISNGSVDYPKLGIYLNSLPCDQTIEVEWFEYRRTIEYKTGYKNSYTDKDGLVRKFINTLAEEPTKVSRLILWDDVMSVYGNWDSFPNYVQLKQAYERTWWFHKEKDQLRDIQINRILN